LLFNFRMFSIIAERAYQTIKGPVYSLDDALSVFGYYFQAYEDTFREVHPNINAKQIASIIERMPCIDDLRGGSIDIYPTDYPVLIDQHFETQYRNCDYNINHFFSGDIRALRYYEKLY
jgi:hypothetical protein